MNMPHRRTRRRWAGRAGIEALQRIEVLMTGILAARLRQEVGECMGGTVGLRSSHSLHRCIFVLMVETARGDEVETGIVG